MNAAHRDAVERMPDTRHASFETQVASKHTPPEKTESRIDPETEEALNQTAVTLELLIEEAPIAKVAKQVLRADDRLQEQMAKYALEASRRYGIPVAELDDTEWDNALASAVEERQQELVDKGYQFDEEGTMLEFGKRLEGMDAVDARELTILRGVLEHAAHQHDSSAALELQPSIPTKSGAESIDVLGSILNRSELKAMDPRIKNALASDTGLRREIAERITLYAEELNRKPDQLSTTQIGEVIREVANAHLAELRHRGVPITESGDLIPGKRIAASDRLELEKTQQLLEAAAGAEGSLVRNDNQLEARTKLKPTARPVRPAVAPAPKRSSSVWNRIGSRVGRFLAGVGIWLGGTSGGDFDQSSQVAAREQAPDRPLPTYARSEQSTEQELPSETMTFTEEESNRVMDEGTRPAEMVFSDEEGMEVEEDFTNVMKEQVASAVKLADVRNRNFDRLTVEQQEAPTAEQESRLERADIETQAPRRATAKRPVGVKRSTSSKFDADSFTAAGKDALRGVVGTPEGTQRRVEAMRAGKKPLPVEAEAVLGAVQEYVQTVAKPKAEVSPNKGGAANELLKTVPKAPEKRRTIAKYKLSTARLAQERAAGGEVTDGMQELKDAVEKDVKSGELKAEEGKKLLEEIDNITKPAARKVVEQPTVYRKPTSLSRAPKTSRGLEAIRASRAETKKSLDSIDQQIEEVRAAQKRGEIGLRDALLQINQLKDLK